MDFDPSAAFNITEEATEEAVSSSSEYTNSINFDFLDDSKEEFLADSESNLAAFDHYEDSDIISGFEPVLGGQLREKAIWVDEANCIGCQYCVHVASNTFIVEEEYGYSRAIRQDGDSVELISEAIDTCPVDCIYWVDFEDPRR